ncbi:MAG TPA: glycoside hydrolase [Puia sp.]|nr:glycoside hydrolase [Puia sp.]
MSALVCTVYAGRAQSPGGKSSDEKTIQLLIDAGRTYQTVENFAASDAWSCQFTGNWPEAKKNAMADWLFSTDTLTGGQPKGIGLSLWRFNIGAGTAGQGDSSGIPDEWRRTASFTDSGSDQGDHSNTRDDRGDRDDRQRQAGQLWFLKAAQKRGVHQFLAFLNSPPVQLTRNGKAFTSAGRSNIDPEKYPALADYISATLTEVKRSTGIYFNYISPVNEPQWDWSDGNQEGCPYSNEQISGVVKAVDHSLTVNRLSAKILITEAGKIDYLFSGEDKPGKNKQAYAFFNPHSPIYVGDLGRISPVIAAHSYFTTSPWSSAIRSRQQLAAKISTIKGLQYWQSEYCILGDNAGEINGSKRDTGMDAALYLARTIHNDLTVAHASAWQYWLAISPYDYKDGLIYIDKNKRDGNYYGSKMLWALGNYSRFIRPGALCLGVDLKGVDLKNTDTTQNGILASAWQNANHKIALVIINSGEKEISVNLSFRGVAVREAYAYLTSADGNLQRGPVFSTKDLIRIPSRSIMTIIGKGIPRKTEGSKK